jgi:pimeloyl-ACP methyl ester carboxylesterase
MRAGIGEMKLQITHAGAGRTAERPTVVLLHSSASSSRQWSGLIAQLGDRFDAQAVDFHGHGARPDWHGRGPLTLADEVALVEPVLRAAGTIHLVGHSYGGAVALKLAQMFPHAVRSVAVYEPVLFPWLSAADRDSDASREVLGVANGVRMALHQRSYRGAAERFVDYWSGQGTWEHMPPAHQQSIAARMPAVLAHFDAIFREDFALRAVRSSLPVFSMSGANSPRSTRRIAEIIRQRIPGATCEVLPEMGHMGPITHAATVSNRIERFLSQCVAEQRAALHSAIPAPLFSPARRHTPSRAAPPPVRTPSPARP